jgi:hypothetical protein
MGATIAIIENLILFSVFVVATGKRKKYYCCVHSGQLADNLVVIMPKTTIYGTFF